MKRREALLTGLAALAARAARAESLPFRLTEVAPGIHVRQGAMAEATPENADAIANTGCIIGDSAIAVVDPGGSLTDGERLLAAIRALSDRPIRYVVQTHFHPDHCFGAAAFLPDGPVFVGHARMPGAIAARGEYYRQRLADSLGEAQAGRPVVPTFLVAVESSFDLGNRVLDLRAHPTAHTDNDLTLFDRRTATLWAGDLLFVDRVPSIDGSLLGWLRVLGDLEAVPAARAVPGHGPPSVPWPAGAAAEERYLRVLEREIRDLQARGGTIEEAAATVGVEERDNWLLFDDYNGRNVTAAFAELEWD
ncbi:MAG: quinoprotein relay system zinc metallohydrolase 2 [Acetobacteraceae bacterium]|nr:quinoprotein relay system zinc metallohydrolase 2 [Acetobacteraceae bacterium]